MYHRSNNQNITQRGVLMYYIGDEMYRHRVAPYIIEWETKTCACPLASYGPRVKYHYYSVRTF